MIFIYDLDDGRQRLSIESKLILLMFLRYFLMTFISNFAVTWLIVMIIPSFTLHMESVIMSDLMSFKHLLILVMCKWAELIINSAFILFIGTIICFLNGLLVVILILDFSLSILLFVIFMISTTLFIDKVEKASLIQKMSLTFKDELIFEA